MENPVRNAILERPFFLDLVNSFLQKPGGTCSGGATSMSTNAILNLLAPPVGCEFALTEPVKNGDLYRTQNVNFSLKNRPWNFQFSSTATRRGRPRRSYKLKEVYSTSSNRPSASDSSTEPSSETSLRELIDLYGGLQEENLAVANEILQKRGKILFDFENILTEVALDSLVGVARHPGKKHKLKEAVDHLFNVSGEWSLAAET